MIAVTRLNGSELVVNADLIETVESTPETLVTLVDGKTYRVRESVREIVERAGAFRASILCRLDAPQVAGGLRLLPGSQD
ncbi:MAG TPA: flagellar FlbD family protein [Acidimicrobiales bacterium]|nr:flagellar FlbD family protein [Acidimicrobiales bacterium]